MKSRQQILEQIEFRKQQIKKTEVIIESLYDKKQFGQAEVFIQLNRIEKSMISELQWVLD